jgi:hypothetical protein
LGPDTVLRDWIGGLVDRVVFWYVFTNLIAFFEGASNFAVCAKIPSVMLEIGRGGKVGKWSLVKFLLLKMILWASKKIDMKIKNSVVIPKINAAKLKTNILRTNYSIPLTGILVNLALTVPFPSRSHDSWCSVIDVAAIINCTRAACGWYHLAKSLYGDQVYGLLFSCLFHSKPFTIFVSG